MTFREFVRRVSTGLTLLVLLGIIALSIFDYFQSERECLEKNIWHEAGVEPLAGKRAVGLVTALRTISGIYPYSICGTVYQRLQFSWTRDREKVRTPLSVGQQLAVKEVAAEILQLRKNPNALIKAAAEIGIPADGYFYKREDNLQVSERSKRFFDRCLMAVMDLKDPAGQKQLVIGAHAFYRPRPGGCLPDIPIKEVPKKIEKKK